MLIRFIYYIYNYRLLYYLPMEMWATEWFMKYQIEQLEKENKKLKEDNEKLQEYKFMYEWLCK